MKRNRFHFNLLTYYSYRSFQALLGGTMVIPGVQGDMDIKVWMFAY